MLKVAATTAAKALALSLTSEVRANGSTELQAIGAGAVNQATKAIAIARGYVAPNGLDLICTPTFLMVSIDGAEKTAIKFLVEVRRG